MTAFCAGRNKKGIPGQLPSGMTNRRRQHRQLNEQRRPQRVQVSSGWSARPASLIVWCKPWKPTSTLGRRQRKCCAGTRRFMRQRRDRANNSTRSRDRGQAKAGAKRLAQRLSERAIIAPTGRIATGRNFVRLRSIQNAKHRCAMSSNNIKPEPIAVSPKQATQLVPIGITKLYEAINAGALQSTLVGGRTAGSTSNH